MEPNETYLKVTALFGKRKSFAIYTNDSLLFQGKHVTMEDASEILDCIVKPDDRDDIDISGTNLEFRVSMIGEFPPTLCEAMSMLHKLQAVA